MNTYNLKDFPLQPLTYQIIGIGMEIHRQLGKGFLEVVYKDAFEYELRMRNILYEREKEYEVLYIGVVLPHRFYADFVIGEKIIFLKDGVKEWEGSNKEIFITENEAVVNFVYSSNLFRKVREAYLKETK